RAYIGVHYGRALFEPGIAATTSIDSIREMAAHFALAEGVVTELDLNTRIWTKGVDASLLERVAEKDDALLEEEMASGTMTARDLWKVAEAKVDGLHDQDDAIVAQPADAFPRIESSPGGVMVRYPIGVAFIAAFLLSLGCGVIGLAALRELPSALDLGSAGAWLQRIPRLPRATALVTGAPIPWLIGCWILSGITMLGWSGRVRRVEVTADAVRVWRGIRPFPRVYPRPPYDRILRIEKSVHLAKDDGFKLINPTASPMLTVDDARWVTSELRRAMKASQTTR
ncbi:MAG: hypothetical protein ABI880_16735, partial [Acidobacteriota bacterium]